MADDELPCWCGGGPWDERFRTPTFGLLRCPTCGGFRIDPPPVTGDDEAEAFYTEYYEAGPDGAPAPGRRSRYWRVARQVGELDRAGGAALDVGCGWGDLCAELLAAGWQRVVGVEASRSRLDAARHRVPGATFHPTPLASLPEPPGSFDLVVLDNVVEHLVAPVATLGEVRPFLAGDGRLVAITPNMASGHFRLLGRRWTPELSPHAHVFLFTAASLRRAVERAGFVVEHAGDFHLPVWPLRSWRADRRTGGLKAVVWRAGQEAGGLYGRLVGAGPMLYVVARPR